MTRFNRPRRIDAHFLSHVMHGCSCDPTKLTQCVMCGIPLPEERKWRDTCGPKCLRYRNELACIAAEDAGSI